jgi:hypothetical protein
VTVTYLCGGREGWGRERGRCEGEIMEEELDMEGE